MASMYSAKVMEHFANPHNVGEIPDQAVKAALSDYYRRQGIDPEPIVGKLEEDCDHCESCGH